MVKTRGWDFPGLRRHWSFIVCFMIRPMEDLYAGRLLQAFSEVEWVYVETPEEGMKVVGYLERSE